MDKIISVSDTGPSEHDADGRMIVLTENGRIWILEGSGGGFSNLKKTDWYEISPPPGCQIEVPNKDGLARPAIHSA